MNIRYQNIPSYKTKIRTMIIYKLEEQQKILRNTRVTKD